MAWSVSSQVLPFGTPCSTSAACPCKAVIRYEDFSWRVQPLCSATVSSWHRNTVHAAVLSNSGSLAVLKLFSVPHLYPANSLASSSRVWNSFLTASIFSKVTCLFERVSICRVVRSKQRLFVSHSWLPCNHLVLLESHVHFLLPSNDGSRPEHATIL
jgi:hypothetical protein